MVECSNRIVGQSARGVTEKSAARVAAVRVASRSHLAAQLLLRLLRLRRQVQLRHDQLRIEAQQLRHHRRQVARDRAKLEEDGCGARRGRGGRCSKGGERLGEGQVDPKKQGSGAFACRPPQTLPNPPLRNSRLVC